IDRACEIALRPLELRPGSQPLEALLLKLLRRAGPEGLGLVEQLRAAVRMAAQKFDVGELLTRVREDGGIGAGSIFGDKSFEQVAGSLDVFERAVQVGKRQNQWPGELRPLAILLQHALRALVDHVLGCGFLSAFGADCATEHPCQAIPQRFLARSIATRDITFDPGTASLPRRDSHPAR